MNYRKYGKAPYKVVLVHGGPGANGSMKPVAEKLAQSYGVIEMLHNEKSVAGQINELKQVITEQCTIKVTLIGHSWGAMLGYMFASQHTELLRKIVMIGSASLEEKDYPVLQKNREQKLSEKEREELKELRAKFRNPTTLAEMNIIFGRFGKLMEKLDTYDEIEIDQDYTMCRYDVFSKIWPEAHNMRKQNKIHPMGKKINCPVVAVHGENDSHPSYGLKESLESVIKDLTFYTLKKCGHTPWVERQAIDEFYEIMFKEIN